MRLTDEHKRAVAAWTDPRQGVDPPDLLLHLGVEDEGHPARPQRPRRFTRVSVRAVHGSLTDMMRAAEHCCIYLFHNEQELTAIQKQGKSRQSSWSINMGGQ